MPVMGMTTMDRGGIGFRLHQASDIGASTASLLSVNSLRCGLSIHSVGCSRLSCSRQAAPRLRCSRQESFSWAGSSFNTASASCDRS